MLLIAVPFLAGEAKDRLRDLYHARTPRPTAFPASARPDQICITWHGDPCASQAVQWRSAPSDAEGVLQYRKKDSAENAVTEVTAARSVLNDPLIANNPVVHRFEARLTGLEPATAYVYRVGSKTGDAWSDWAEFRTAPCRGESFSFLYLGDAQVGFDTWETMLHQACARCPKAAFCIMAGDLANRGRDRDDWDNLFHATRGVFDRMPVVPAIGNHECSSGTLPQLYLDQFALPENGPEGVLAERAYHFEYGNALFVVLDSNIAAKKQRAWLEKQLADSKATWKFAVYHHPAYSSAPHRDNTEVREEWCDLFDKYHVDMAFQGHDHAYLRTPPMKGEKAVGSPTEGTIYVVSDSGSKFYEQGQHEYAAVAFPKVSTYQTIDIEAGAADKLTYRAYDRDGKLRDEVVIEKSGPGPAAPAAASAGTAARP